MELAKSFLTLHEAGTRSLSLRCSWGWGGPTFLIAEMKVLDCWDDISIFPSWQGPCRSALSTHCKRERELTSHFCWMKFPRKSPKRRNIWNKVSKISSDLCPPNIRMLCWQVEESSPQVSPDFCNQILEISSQTSARISTAHFCRYSSPKRERERARERKQKKNRSRLSRWGGSVRRLDEERAPHLDHHGQGRTCKAHNGQGGPKAFLEGASGGARSTLYQFGVSHPFHSEP